MSLGALTMGLVVLNYLIQPWKEIVKNLFLEFLCDLFLQFNRGIVHAVYTGSIYADPRRDCTRGTRDHFAIHPVLPTPDSFTYRVVPAPPAVSVYSDPTGATTAFSGVPAPVNHNTPPAPSVMRVPSELI